VCKCGEDCWRVDACGSGCALVQRWANRCKQENLDGIQHVFPGNNVVFERPQPSGSAAKKGKVCPTYHVIYAESVSTLIHSLKGSSLLLASSDHVL
jgi:hypothetical protein